MAHTFTRLLYHIIFSTKHRQPQIDSVISSDLLAYLGGTIRGIDGVPLIVNGVEDHVHLLIVLPQTVSVADAVKTNSSAWVHDKWPERSDFAWQTGYGAFTVSASRREHVRRFIERQQEHHRRTSFEDKFKELLERHGISYDPRFVLD